MNPKESCLPPCPGSDIAHITSFMRVIRAGEGDHEFPEQTHLRRHHDHAPRDHRANAVPAVIAADGPKAAERFFTFFTDNIRNKNTRAAY